MMRTSNPTLNPAAFQGERVIGDAGSMTLQGTINKSFILFLLLLLSASWIWGKLINLPTLYAEESAVQAASSVMPFIIGGGIVGFILALVTCFKRSISGITSPLYAICQGFVLGGVSAMFEISYPGIVIQAVALTFGTLFAMLLVYKSGLIRPSEKFFIGIASATGAIFLVYLVNFILGFFGRNLPFIYSSSPLGIAFSLIVVAIAALNLILDFHIIEQGIEHGAPKYMEWYGAFGLMVTLIWLYLEILRLLAKMRNRR